MVRGERCGLVDWPGRDGRCFQPLGVRGIRGARTCCFPEIRRFRSSGVPRRRVMRWAVAFVVLPVGGFEAVSGAWRERGDTA